jgi:ABC-type branched-subunit amino acid transport system substrate-binding protein
MRPGSERDRLRRDRSAEVNGRRRLVALAACTALACSACGLSGSSVHQLGQAMSSGNAAALAAGGLAGAGAGSRLAGGRHVGGGVVGGGLSGGGGSAGGGAGTSAGGGGGGAGSRPLGGSNASGGNPAASGPAYERTGITASTIYLGIHAPETGAAPVPLQAFATGAKLFWENHTIFGHKVVMQFMDDQYNPSVARQVCEQMSRTDFLVLGGAGTDQIQSCATDPVLAASHTPYLSAGVTTNGLTSLFNYFAVTMTYAAQSPGVYQMARQLYPSQASGKWAIVTENTPNFNDATSSIASVLSQHGIHYVIIRTPKYYADSDAQTAVSRARAYGAQTVYLDVDPNFWISMVKYAQSQLYTPAWVGPGITNGENLVASPVCGEQPQVKAAFLSPSPGLDRQPPGFASENNPPPDSPASERDIEMLIYGLSEITYHAMLSTGSIANLTRDNFIRDLPRFAAGYNRDSGPLTVDPGESFHGTHFGGAGMWELQLSCSDQQYHTVGAISG